MEPHEQRVIDEKKALSEKKVKLDAFMQGSVFKSLSDYDRILLEHQSIVMGLYEKILGLRITNMTEKNATQYFTHESTGSHVLCRPSIRLSAPNSSAKNKSQ